MIKNNNSKPKVIISNKGLSIKKLGKNIRNRPIIRDININVNRGEIVGLLGPNGASKTTCFYTIMGLYSADWNNYLKWNRYYSLSCLLKSKKWIRLSTQESSIFRGMTVEQNIGQFYKL